MPLETTELNQSAVLMSLEGRNTYGEPKITSVVPINVRWRESKKEVKAENDETVITDGVVYVDRDVTIGSLLVSGSVTMGFLTDENGNLILTEPDGQPIKLQGAAYEDSFSAIYQVVDFEKIPDLKGRNYRRRVLVERYKDL